MLNINPSTHPLHTHDCDVSLKVTNSNELEMSVTHDWNSYGQGSELVCFGRGENQRSFRLPATQRTSKDSKGFLAS